MRFTKRRTPGLIYAAMCRCPCGAGLAYGKNMDYWDCSAILLGTAVPSGQLASLMHTDKLPFVFYEIKSEKQSANGMTTRPASHQ